MPWNEPGGNNQQDPWSGKKRGGSNDPEELIRKLNQKLSALFGGGSGGSGGNDAGAKGVALLGSLLIGGWLLSGFYTVDARQQGLVMRFGAYQQTTGPGLHWRLPYPVESVEVLDVNQNRSANDRSTILTKDENMVEIGVSVQYQIRNAEEYAFNIKDVDGSDQNNTLYQVMRGSTREVIGRNNMDFILTEGREQIAGDILLLMQKILDNYKSGLQVLTVNLTYAEAPAEVKEAFDDANRAREDANLFKNEADSYSKKVVPEARGKAARTLAEAEATRQSAIARAEGDTARFSQLLAEYRKAPEVTRQRLYLETMETVMAESRNVIIDTKNGQNTIILPNSMAALPPQASVPVATANSTTASTSAAPVANKTPAPNNPAPVTTAPANVQTNMDVRGSGRDTSEREGR